MFSFLTRSSLYLRGSTQRRPEVKIHPMRQQFLLRHSPENFFLKMAENYCFFKHFTEQIAAFHGKLGGSVAQARDNFGNTSLFLSEIKYIFRPQHKSPERGELSVAFSLIIVCI